jgi:hypothetical protein
MRKIIRGLLTLTFCVGAAAPAFAGTYTTTMVQAAVGDYIDCLVSNVGTTPVNVTVKFFNYPGSEVTASGGNDCLAMSGVLPAGVTCGAYLGGSGFVRCEVTASSSKVRAAVIVFDGTTGRSVTSVPATKK